jgi:hypothetical protein
LRAITKISCSFTDGRRRRSNPDDTDVDRRSDRGGEERFSRLQVRNCGGRSVTSGFAAADGELATMS